MPGLSRKVARRCALGLALAAAITLVPVRPVAAAPAGELVRATSFWEAALEWLASLVGPATPDPGPAGGGAGNAAGVCRGDEGACIDPNGGSAGGGAGNAAGVCQGDQGACVDPNG